MRRIFWPVVLFLVSGCSHTMSVPANFVSSNPMQFTERALHEKSAYLVVTPKFVNYQFKKSSYNWAGGSLFPDTLIFELGNTLTIEIDNLTRSLFGTTTQVASLEAVRSGRMARFDFVVVPEIQNSSLELPVVRFGLIDAEITVKYSFYRGDESLITSVIVTGKGQKTLVLTRQNYVEAFEEAIKDLMVKSKDQFSAVLSIKDP